MVRGWKREVAGGWGCTAGGTYGVVKVEAVPVEVLRLGDALEAFFVLGELLLVGIAPLLDPFLEAFDDSLVERVDLALGRLGLGERGTER